MTISTTLIGSEYIGDNTGGSPPGPTPVGTQAINLSVGDTLIVALGHLGAGTGPAEQVFLTTDTAQLSLATSNTAVDQDTGTEVWWYTADHTISGDTVSFQWSGNPGPILLIIYRKVTGLAVQDDPPNPPPPDVEASNFGTVNPGPTQTPDAQNSLPTNFSNEFLYAVVMFNHQDTPFGTWGGGFTDGELLLGPSFDMNVVLNDAYQIVSSTGTYNATKTVANNFYGPAWTISFATFEASGGGGGGGIGLPGFYFSPVVGGVGSAIMIIGTGLTGTTSVTFNGTSATFTIISDRQIIAIVPVGATTGPIVITIGGTDYTFDTNFLVLDTDNLGGPAIMHYS